MTEQWRDVQGYEGSYEVSSYGRVKRTGSGQGARPGLRALPLDSKGYVVVRLSKDGRGRTFKGHRLVAQAFLGDPPPGMQVNHRNGMRADNRIENLEYVTPGDNMRHAYRVLGRAKARPRGERAHAAKLVAADIPRIRELVKKDTTQRAVAKQFGVHFATINDIIQGKTWTHV